MFKMIRFSFVLKFSIWFKTLVSLKLNQIHTLTFLYQNLNVIVCYSVNAVKRKVEKQVVVVIGLGMIDVLLY